MEDGNVLQYVTGWPQLIGLIVLVIATLVAKLTHARDRKNRQALVWGLLGLGALGVLGGIGLEAARLRSPHEAPPPPEPKPEIQVTGNDVSGSGHAVGVGNSVNGPATTADEARSVSVSGNTITGTGHAVGVHDVVNAPKSSSQ